MKFTPLSFLFRLLIALVLVFASYNPAEPWSFYHWAVKPLLVNFNDFTIFKALVGVALLIGWSVFLNATFNSLGLFGTLMAVAFFGLAFWWIIDEGWISLEQPNTLNWLVLVALSLVLAVGISWSHISRRLTGQYDVDETDD